MNTANRTRIAAFFTAFVMTVAVNGATLAMFDTVARGGHTDGAKTAVALNTVTITAKRS